MVVAGSGNRADAMDLPHPAHRLHLHLHLDPRHHHRIHIRLCHYTTHLLPAAPSVQHHQQAPVPPHSFPNARPHPTAAPWHLEDDPPLAHSITAAPAWLQQGGEPAMDPEEAALQPEDVYLADDDEEEPVFVLTDEWAEFFAKADAKRRLAKQQKKKNSSRNK